jgi:hypothetical protein
LFAEGLEERVVREKVPRTATGDGYMVERDGSDYVVKRVGWRDRCSELSDCCCGREGLGGGARMVPAVLGVVEEIPG